MEAVILLGDPTSSGGRIISATGSMYVDGMPVACVGDEATCHLEGHKGTITGYRLDATVSMADPRNPYAAVVDPTINPKGLMQILGRMLLPESLRSVAVIRGIVSNFKPNRSITAYHWSGPNSNTFSHWFGTQLGFDFSAMSASRYRLIGFDNQMEVIQ